MSNQQMDFKGREGVALAIGLAGVGSGVFNVWGAFQITTDPVAAYIFAAIVTACEVIAFLSLRWVVQDWDNRQYIKARVGGAILLIAIAGCAISGKRAFQMISVKAEAEYAAELQNHRVLDEIRIQAEAAYKANQTSDTTRDWKNAVTRATEAKVKLEQSKPMPQAVMWLFLVLFEAIKIGGLWAIATPTQRGLTRAQRRAAKRTAKLKEAEADAKFREKLRIIEDPETASDQERDGNVAQFPQTA